MAREAKVVWVPNGSSKYHLAETPVRVHWSNLSLTESYVMLLEKHQPEMNGHHMIDRVHPGSNLKL